VAKKKKYQLLEVIFKRTYIIPLLDEKRTRINGWPLSTVIEDWFEHVPMDSYHATRDTHQVHGSTIMIEANTKEIIESKDK